MQTRSNLNKNISYKPALILYLLIVLFSCNTIERKKGLAENSASSSFILRSQTTAMLVDKDFSYCDTTAIGMESCFLNYNENKYLKQEVCAYDFQGNLIKAVVYQSEGTVSYIKEQLIEDGLFTQSKGWKVEKNELEIKGDSIFSPVIGRIAEADTLKGIIFYLIKSTDGTMGKLKIFEYWK